MGQSPGYFDRRAARKQVKADRRKAEDRDRAVYSKLVPKGPVCGPDGVPVSITVGSTADSSLDDGGDTSGFGIVIVVVVAIVGWVVVKVRRLDPWTVAIRAGKPDKFQRRERYPSERAASEAAAAFAEKVAVDGVAGARSMPRPG